MVRPTPPFQHFSSNFRGDEGAIGPCSEWSAADTVALVGAEPCLFTEFIQTTARSSFDGGLLRFLLPTTRPSLPEWNAPTGWKSMWPNLSRFFTVFAYDWQGNQLGFDKRHVERGEPLVGLLEAGAGKLLQIPATFAEFIDGEIIKNRDAVLASNFYARWRAGQGKPPEFHECIGYRIPLFLNGKDDVENLAASNLDVYLSMTGQLFGETRQR